MQSKGDVFINISTTKIARYSAGCQVWCVSPYEDPCKIIKFFGEKEFIASGQPLREKRKTKMHINL